MDVSRARSHLYVTPENQIRRVRQFPRADFRAVVKPNVDTLYSSVFVDMHKGPWVFRHGDLGARYALFPFMDAWSNVFASPGTRTTGTLP